MVVFRVLALSLAIAIGLQSQNGKKYFFGLFVKKVGNLTCWPN